MDITRELLKQTRWQQANGRKIPITDMDDNHLRNCIRMIQRQLKIVDNEDRRYALALLKAEQTFRKAERANKDKIEGQLTFDIPQVVKADIEPPRSLLRINAAGRLPKDSGKLMQALDAIGLKHHGMPFDEFYDTLDDIDSYGYDGDCF